MVLFDFLDVELDEFLFEDDGPENDTLVRLRNINKETELILQNFGPRNILFENEQSNHLRERLLCLFNEINKNENIINLSIEDEAGIHIPGSFIAEWLLHQNKYVKKFSYHFDINQSEFEILCTAIQQNKIITCFGIDEMRIQGSTKLRMLGQAFRDSIGIKDFEFTFTAENQNEQISFLREMLAPGSNIQSVHIIFSSRTTIESANTIGDIIRANKSLTTFKTECSRQFLIPILHGVSDSVRSGVIVDFDLFCNEAQGIVIDKGENLTIFQMICEMQNLKRFGFYFYNFNKCLSVEIIDENLKRLQSLQCLSICFESFSSYQNDSGRILLQKIAAWKQQCKLHIDVTCNSNTTYACSDILRVLDNLFLEKLTVVVNPVMLSKMSKHIPKWKFLNDLDLDVDYSPCGDDNAHNRRLQQIQFATDICKNGSLKNVSVKWFDNHWNDDAQIIIGKAVERNKLLADIVVAPENVPDKKWPYLLETANELGLDFSFQMMPYLFCRFLAADEKTNDSRLTCKRRRM